VERDLVLLQPEGVHHPSGTVQWLEHVPVSRHHHLRLHREDDMRRLARSLAGRGVGLVLSGGGARCFAQIGVIRALQEASVPIDWVAGSSAGAVVGAQVALGWDWTTILDRSRRLVDGRRLMDFTFPMVSLLAAGRLSRALAQLFDDIQIEDLWLGYFCTSSNLATASLRIHRQGPIRRAVRASCALPGVVPPLLEGGELLIDGGVLDNLPVEAMKEICDGGPVIAVDISAEFQLGKAYQFGEGVSARQLVLNRVNPLARTRLVVPSIVNILLRTVELQAVRSRMDQRVQADLYLQPPVDMFGIFETNSIDRLVEIGYRYAQEKFAGWRSGEGALWA
jgi:predicted acylesterase/phospholipase RssA